MSKSQIAQTKYYLGGGLYDSTSHFGSTEDIYIWERGTNTYDDTRSTFWVGTVGLMYPSDEYLTYAKGVDKTCYNDPYYCKDSYSSWDIDHPDIPGIPTNGWIYSSNIMENQNNIQGIWFLSPRSDQSNLVFMNAYTGNICLYGDDFHDAKSNIRPVVYLKSSIQIIDGTGEQNNPYKLGL